jgi:hypothetical protein
MRIISFESALMADEEFTSLLEKVNSDVLVY